MKIKVLNEYKESTGYRRLFECIKEEGIDSVLGLITDMKALENRNLVLSAVLGGYHDTLSLTKKNKSVIKYLREYRNDLQKINLTSEELINELHILTTKSADVINTYIENTKLLEKLNVERIKIVSQLSLLNNAFECEIYRDVKDNIVNIYKYYTDGIINPEEERLVDDIYNVSRIYFTIDKDFDSPTFLLKAVNTEHKTGYREIIITGFDFKSLYLPTEEELCSYEIPACLKLTK